MHSQAQEPRPQTESISPSKIFLDAGGIYPREVIFRTERGERKVYRLIKTKSECLTLNK